MGLLGLCLLSSCTPRVSPPSSVPAGVEDVRLDPARDASVRLLQEAYRAYVQERFLTAVRFFQRFLDDFPEAPRSPEARWWLGRSLEQVGSLRAAAEQYRLLTSAQPGGPAQVYGAHARRRLGELGRLRAGYTPVDLRQVAIQVGAEHFPPPAGRAEWLRALVQTGVTAVMLESPLAAGAGSATGRSEAWTGLVAEAHRLGLQVWLELDVHQAKGFSLKPEWVSRNESAGPSEASPARPDVAHPDYQAYLEGLVRSFAASGYDGIVVRARDAVGFSDEYSDGSFRVFTESFGLALSPPEVLRVQQGPGATTRDRADAYWRWAGWKAGRYAGLAERFRRMLRHTNPLAVVLVEVHEIAVESPVQALEWYGEDAAELARSGSAVVVRRGESKEDVLFERLAQQIKNPDQLWVRRSIPWPAAALSLESLRRLLGNVRDTVRWNLLVDAEPLAPLP